MIRMRLTERLELVGRAAVFEAAAGVHVGQDHGLFRRQDLCRLRHEVHAAEDDHIAGGLLPLAGQLQRVADEVRNLEDFRALIVVGEDDGVPLALEGRDSANDVGEPLALRWIVNVGLAQPQQRLRQLRAGLAGRLDSGLHHPRTFA